jgi:hypothetical protein
MVLYQGRMDQWAQTHYYGVIPVEKGVNQTALSLIL